MYHIYCDENRPEMIGKKDPIDRYAVLGGVWIKKSNVRKIKRDIQRLREKHNLFGEIKWKNVSPSKLDFYLDLVDLFFECDNIRFRCIVVDATKVNLQKFHDSDQELGFYKFYYQLIYHWLDWNRDYAIFLDYKKNKQHDRLSTLRTILNRASMADVVNVQAIESKQSSLIQLVDVLMGAVGYKFNEYDTSDAKLAVINRIEERIGHVLQPTLKNQSKFNIFKILL